MSSLSGGDYLNFNANTARLKASGHRLVIWYD
jgi:hypothetical protein